MKIKTGTAAVILAIAASSTSPAYAGGFLDAAFESEIEEPVILEDDDDETPIWIFLALIAAAALAVGGAGGGS